MTISTWLVDLPQEDCERLLDISRLGRVAVLIDGRPEIFPVNHVFDDIHRCVAFPTNDNTKLHAALTWPFVAFEVDGMEPDPPTGWSVLVVGRAEEITDEYDTRRLSAKRTTLWRAGENVRWVRIVAEKTTGRRIYGPHGP